MKQGYGMSLQSAPSSNRLGATARAAVRCAAVLIFGWTTGLLFSQETNVAAPERRGGLQLRSISAYGIYYSSGLLNGPVGLQAGGSNLSSDVSLGGSMLIDWAKFTDRSNVSISYSPSYIGRVNYSSLDALNHRLSFNTSRKLAPRWVFVFSSAGDYSSTEQSLFASTSLSTVASVPATFGDLASAMLSSKFTNNPQLGVALTNSPLVESPVRTLLYGQRMLTASARTSLSYSYSPRLEFTIAGGASRSQHVSTDAPTAGPDTALVPSTTNGDLSFAVSYSLSPYTHVGGTVTTVRSASPLFAGYTTTSMATLGRNFKRRWFVQLQGGVGVTNAVRQSYVGKSSTTPHPAATGRLGFKTFSHTILGSLDRTVSDTFGVGAFTSYSVNATWRWVRPGSSWWLESALGWQQLRGGNALANTSGWRGTVGLNRAVGVHFVLLTQYAYLYYSGGLLNTGSGLSQSAVRVSVLWTPHPLAIH
jgi:hypothetical protein